MYIYIYIAPTAAMPRTIGFSEDSLGAKPVATCSESRKYNYRMYT